MNPHALISLELLYRLCGLLFGVLTMRTACDAAHPKRWGSTIFWSVLAVIFLAGEYLPTLAVGYAIVLLVVLAALGQVGVGSGVAASGSRAVAGGGEPGRHGGPDRPRSAPAATAIGRPLREASYNKAPRPPVAATTNPACPVVSYSGAEAERLGNRVFLPALLVPAVALIGSRGIGYLHYGDYWLGDPKQATLAALGLGAIVGLIVGVRVVGARASTPLREGSRLVELLGWSLILPQLLAALGGVFQQCGVGTVVADLLARILPAHSALIAVVAYCVGMALFTICVGNAFAAFAVITGGIGLPLIVHEHHGNPAIMAALGMLSGYCGTLVTPMAANFNLVPVLLLDLPDRNAVIKAQAPIAGALLLANVAVMYACVYRF